MFFSIKMQPVNNLISFCLEGPGSVFRNLDRDDKKLLEENHHISHFRRGDILLREGDRPSELMCLATGKVKIIKKGIGGRGQILSLVPPQGLIGYRALFSETTYCASAIAIEESVACSFRKETVLDLTYRNPDLALRMMRVFAEEMRFINHRTVSLTQKHIRGRLAESLLFLRDIYGYMPDGKTLNVYLPREDLASFSNMTTSNAIRTLSNLAAEEVIAIERKKIIILDAYRLEKISTLG